MPQDISTLSTGVNLPPEVSGEIWQETIQSSFIQSAVERMDFPGNGVSIDVITGDPVAQFVAETEMKPVSNPTVSSKTVYPHTIAVIETFSNKFKRNKGALYNALINRMPQAIAKRFDRAVLFGEGAPATNFDTLVDVPSVSIATNPYGGLLAALGSVVDTDDADINGWALSPQGEILLMGQVDEHGRPLFIDSINNDGNIGRLLGRPAFKHRWVGKPGTAGAPGTPATVGFGGDWTGARWGYSEGITIDINTKGSVTLDGGEVINLWQRNMFAVRIEVEVGFRLRDEDRFVRLTGTTPA